MLADFAKPPARYRSMPLWVWNGEMTEARITEMLEQFAAQGLGGVFVHPRPGLITEYLSDRWFALWRHAMHECRRLDLQCNIYDENSYPSGFAGGHVPARAPHLAVQYVIATTHRCRPVRRSGELLSAYRLAPETPPAPLAPDADLDAAVDGGPVLTLELRRAAGTPWTAGFPMVDETHPDVAREFIATTYEAYARQVGDEFGRTVQFAFDDEPAPGAFAEGYQAGPILPMSRRLLREFRREHGYDLLPRLADLFVENAGPQVFATRFDYYKLLQRLWTQNFLKPLYDWCGAHGLQFTGHFYEHEWPAVMFNVNSMDAYRWLHVPGIDLLAPQVDFADAANSSLFLLTVRELNSVANQLGRPRALCEAHGVGGYEARLEDFKRLSDWLMVHGVNFIVQHLSFETIGGARKYDHPPTFSDHSPWWADYRLHADHVARLSVALTQGRQRNRVLVLHPTTTGWLYSVPGGESSNEPLRELRAGQSRLVQWLCDRQVDFDLGDELLMQDLAHVHPSGLSVGERRYTLVVLPSGMENWCQSTLALLDRYLQAGGVVLALGDPPQFVDGRPDDRPAQLAAAWQARGWRRLQSLEELQIELDRLVPPLITTDDGRHLPALVGHQARWLDDGSVLHLMTNSGHVPVRLRVRLAGHNLSQLDTSTGQNAPVEFEPSSEAGSLTAWLELPPAGHALWLASPTIERTLAGEASSRARPYWRQEAPVPDRKGLTQEIIVEEFIRVERLSPNVLTLDFCDLTVEGESYPGLYVTQANSRAWQAHGFDRDVWDGAVQFRRNWLTTCMQFEADSGFRAAYHFEVDASDWEAFKGNAKLELALERPELYRVEVNGRTVLAPLGASTAWLSLTPRRPVSFDGARRWLDETIRAASIGDLIRPGQNSVTLSAQPFHILCEIDRVYLLGEFALQPASPGFRIVPPQPLALGDWTRQGLPMYPGSVRYTAEVAIPKSVDSLSLHVPEWSGSVIRVRLDDRDVGRIAFPPYEMRLNTGIDAGTHLLQLEVVGTLKNLLGPHFCRRPLRNRWNGPNAWQDPVAGPANGADYEILPYGLLGPVRLGM